MTLTLAVTGRRPGRKYIARRATRDALARLFAGLGRPFRLISSLSEGAERDAASTALAAGGRLAVVTPFGLDRFEREFSTDESLAEFRRLLEQAETVRSLPSEALAGPERQAAYAAAGFAMLDQAERLIAVWCGLAGPHGGPATIIAEAKRRGMEIDWFHAMGQAPPRRWNEHGWEAPPD